MKRLLVLAVLAFAAVSASPAASDPYYCDSPAPLVELVTIENAAACGSTFPLAMSSCIFSELHMTWVQVWYSPWRGVYVEPC